MSKSKLKSRVNYPVFVKINGESVRLSPRQEVTINDLNSVIESQLPKGVVLIKK